MFSLKIIQAGQPNPLPEALQVFSKEKVDVSSAVP
jgi:hypothetical protein